MEIILPSWAERQLSSDPSRHQVGRGDKTFPVVVAVRLWGPEKLHRSEPSGAAMDERSEATSREGKARDMTKMTGSQSTSTYSTAAIIELGECSFCLRRCLALDTTISKLNRLLVRRFCDDQFRTSPWRNPSLSFWSGPKRRRHVSCTRPPAVCCS